MAGNQEWESESQTALSAQVFQILLSLLDEDLHGYALIQDIRRRTDGEVVLTASTLYAATKRLVSAGWIQEVELASPPPDHDARRRYYKLTESGRAAAKAEAKRLTQLLRVASAKKLIPRSAI